jgi:thymidylate synthase (FAD)
MKITVIKPSGVVRTDTTGMLKHIENCGRTCYKSEGRITKTSAGDFVRKIIARGHESVLEHASITATVIGDRSMSHQLVRHRLVAYSQESQRFCNYGKLGFQVVCPPSIGVPAGAYHFLPSEGYLYTDEACRQEVDCCDWSDLQLKWLCNRASDYEEYLAMLEEGIKPEDARSCLPNATKTELAVTCNIRMWRHIFRDRALNPRAQWQIKEIMLDLLTQMNESVPELFEDLYE